MVYYYTIKLFGSIMLLDFNKVEDSETYQYSIYIYMATIKVLFKHMECHFSRVSEWSRGDKEHNRQRRVAAHRRHWLHWRQRRALHCWSIEGTDQIQRISSCSSRTWSLASLSLQYHWCCCCPVSVKKLITWWWSNIIYLFKYVFLLLIVNFKFQNERWCSWWGSRCIRCEIKWFSDHWGWDQAIYF